jgi:hypothetical protein
LPVRIANKDTFLILVHSRHLALEHGRVLLALENPPDRETNLTGRQNRRCHLVEQGLKQVVIRAIDQDDFRGRVLESLGGGESAKAAADYDDSRLSHLLLNFFSPSSNTNAREQCNRLAIWKPLKAKGSKRRNRERVFSK